jgi:hypothetical protein
LTTAFRRNILPPSSRSNLRTTIWISLLNDFPVTEAATCHLLGFPFTFVITAMPTLLLRVAQTDV